MNICMLVDSWWPEMGGGQVHVRNLSIALAEEFGHDIDIYTRALKDESGKVYDQTESLADGRVTVYRCGVPTEFLNPIGRITSPFSMYLKSRRKDYDVVHGHTFLPAIPTRIAGLIDRMPTVFTVHGTAIPSGVGFDTSSLGNKVKRKIEKLFVLHFDYDQVISVNQEHLGLLDPHHENVSYIPNGVDVDRFDVDEETEQGRILFLGRLAPKKRVTDLVQAFSEIHGDFPESELVIVGSGPLEGKLRETIDSEGLQDAVSLEGRVPDKTIPHYYASSELFVLPSVWEGHPLTLLEAWASGLPVIATDIEGISEFVDHGENGYLVEPENPDDLADALRYALDNKEEARSWGRDGRKLVRRKYTWEDTARKTERLYRNLNIS